MAVYQLMVILALVGIGSTTPELLADPFSDPRILPTFNSQRNLTEHYFTQKTDHFNPLDSSSFQQRYFINDDYYVEGGPVFLFLNGEWQANGGFTLFSSFMGRLAHNAAALTVELEHRYYGKSYPTPDIETQNLRFLTIDQALEDAANFAVEVIRKQMGLTSHIVLFGVSYSASLAAWARARFPHIFHAAYASSGPGLAQIDFYKYHEGTGYAMGLSNPECPVVVRQSMDQLQALIAEGGTSLDYVNEIFFLCDPGLDNTEPKDIATFNSMIANMFGALVQYAGPDGQNHTCEQIMYGPGTPLENMAEIVKQGYLGRCLRVDHDLVVAFYRNITIANPNLFTRQLLYQMCTELGWFYSLSSPNQPFGQLFFVDFFTDWCWMVFGDEFTVELLQAGVDRINLVHGAQDPEVTRVLFMQGSLDQYFQLAVNHTLGPDTPLILIEGGSHSSDMAMNVTSDSPELVAAREEAEQILTEWLALP